MVNEVRHHYIIISPHFIFHRKKVSLSYRIFHLLSLYVQTLSCWGEYSLYLITYILDQWHENWSRGLVSAISACRFHSHCIILLWMLALKRRTHNRLNNSMANTTQNYGSQDTSLASFGIFTEILMYMCIGADRLEHLGSRIHSA